MPFTEALRIVDIKDLLRGDTVEFHLQEGFVKHSARRVGEKFDDFRIFARIDRHRLGLLRERIHQNDPPLELNSLYLLPVFVVFLNRRRNPRIGG